MVNIFKVNFESVKIGIIYSKVTQFHVADKLSWL